MHALSDRPPWETQLLRCVRGLALLLIGLFYFFLSPGSGFFGGLAYLISGWAMPSLVNVLLAAWLALLVRAHWTARILIFLVASFVLGVNTSLPRLFDTRAAPRVETTILRSLPLTPSLSVDDRLMVATPNNTLDYAFPPSPMGLSVGWNEGCGCMYFAYDSQGGSYYEQIRKVILARRVSQVSGLHFYFPERYPNTPIVHFDYATARSPGWPNAVDITVNMYQGRERVATFIQRQLPSMSLKGMNLDDSKGLDNGHLFVYSTSILMHRNFWMALLAPRLTVQGELPFKAFLDRALPAVN